MHWLEFFDGERQRRVILNAVYYSIGRDATCDICLPCRWVSRHHATLIKLPREEGTFRYQILDGTVGGKPSVNGILVNRHSVKSHVLQHWDGIVIGQVHLVYCVSFPEDELEDGLAIHSKP